MASVITAVVFTEAGRDVGFGHLGRCVALCEALEPLGCASELVVAGEAPAGLVGECRARVTEWRCAIAAETAAMDADIAVIDSYRADQLVYEAIAGAVPVAVYLDDCGRLTYPSGIVVNGSPAAGTFIGDLPVGSTGLLGPAYQLLRAPFWSVPDRVVRPDIRRILLVSGGADAGGMRHVMANALRDAFPNVYLDVVNAPRTSVAMRDAMLAADVAVSAAGQTLYELAVTGTPAIAVCVADNQVLQARALEGEGVVALAGIWGDPQLPEEVVRLVEGLADPDRRAGMTAAGRCLVDGRGAQRTARTCIAVALERTVELRHASRTDESALLELANDPVIRRASFSDAVITAEEHRRWLAERLRDPHTVLFAATRGHDLVGQVRFQVEDDRAVVSISLAERYRGLGFAELLLARATDRMRSAHPDVRTVIAQAKLGNAASIRLFESAGYRVVGFAESLPAGVVELSKPLGPRAIMHP